MRDLRAGLSLLLLVSAACASNASNDAAAAAPMPSAESARTSSGIDVQIDNQNLSDMSVYLLKNNSRWLIGQAGGLRKTTLTIPASLAPADLHVSLLAEPIGSSRRTFTPSLLVPHSQRIYWSIGSDPSMSMASTGE
jgi:hypothetical protein